MPKPAFFVNSQPIPGSIWGMLIRLCGGDKYAAARVFYRAHIAAPEKVIPWIQQGLLPDEDGRRYALLPCAAESDNPQDVQAWCDKVVFRMKGTRAMESLGAILRGAGKA